MFTAAPDPPTNVILRQISNRRVQATWTPPAGFSGATYSVFINSLNLSDGGFPVTETNYTTDPQSTDSNITVHVKATTGSYLSIQAASSTLVIRGKIFKNIHFSVMQTRGCT